MQRKDHIGSRSNLILLNPNPEDGVPSMTGGSLGSNDVKIPKSCG